MTIFLVTLGTLLIAAAVVLTFMSVRYSPAVAFSGLVAFGFSGIAPMGPDLFIFWGIAALIAVGVNFMLPREVACSRIGMGYVAAGALVGLVVGLLLNEAAMIIGAVLGAVAGGIAFSRTPAGRAVDFPSSRFLNYICAKGLPAVITLCQCGVVAVQALTYASI